VYTFGHRNPQGLAWDEEGNLWSTEHGRSGALSGLDEINLIKKEKTMDGHLYKAMKVEKG
jgi:glucose/arabinose dehydrogenase